MKSTLRQLCLFTLISCAATIAGGQHVDIEAKPFSYSDTADDNPVSKLAQELKSRTIKLEYDRDRGHLQSLLMVLDIPVESQSLVFSKTSLQVEHISRRNPRAIYFNDDVYVGWVRGSSLAEISVADANLGAVFYTFDMKPGAPKIARADYTCLGCHLSTMTQGVPGHTVRSIYPGHDGSLDLRRKSFVTDHKSPFAERWGGWYVTGNHGEMVHMGNATLRGDELARERSLNRAELESEFDVEDWLLPDSDIVPQMVLQHQTQMHNVFTRTAFAVRQLIYERETAPNKGLLSDDSESVREYDYTVTKNAKEVVDYLLFCDEAPLTSAVSGSGAFDAVFAARGPRDRQDRSLREFDLQTRLFKYPCSYLIYSPTFDALPVPLRDSVIAQLKDVLQGRNVSPAYAHLSPELRRQILEILADTKPDFANTH